MLELKNITKDYLVGDTSVRALRGISLQFRKNEFVSILGPSGCGKTTLLNIIGGLDRYTSGDLVIDGVSTGEYRDRDWDSYRNHSVGFVFQSYNLIAHQSVLANVELALTLSGISRKERRARAVEVLTKVGLGDQLDKRPNQMSGGQMQRVAIARALINNPSILLADEPTGALDSETSVQVMELLKEVAKDRLVIMVTHNPELAAKYSTRIIRLLDGRVLDDTMPYQETVKAADTRGKAKKPSMSFWTALSLSFHNLMTKKTRTILIAFAGSIGIIGIALILSMSNGVQNLIDRMERETLSSYPLMIERQTVDWTPMLTGSSTADDDTPRDDAHVYSTSPMTGIIDSMIKGSKVNDLGAFKEYLESGKSGIDPLVSDIQYLYSTPMNIYHQSPDGSYHQVNPNQLFSQLGMQTASTGTSSFISYDVWTRISGNEALLKSQYDVVAGRLPERYDEVVLFVDEENRVSDFTLYSLGLLDVSELQNALRAAANGKDVSLDTTTHIYDFDEILGIEFRLLKNTDYFSEENGVWVDRSQDSAYLATVLNDAEPIRVVGILRPSENASTGAVYGTIGYRADLVTHLIEEINQSQIVREQLASPETDVFTGMPFEQAAEPTMQALEAYLATLEPQKQEQYRSYIEQLRAAGQSDDAIAAQLLGGAAGTDQASLESNLERMGASDEAEPEAIYLYPIDFEAKDAIASRIAAYNETLPEDERLTYTDYIGQMISSITTIINAVSYVLIAFVSVSLIVSSIMIGIITYISVLERTREIGILRSIGASKRDISRVFNAETLTIGLGAGLFGIALTLLLILPINSIIRHLTGLSGVAQLPIAGGVILIGISMLLTFIAGLIPSRIASKKDPVVALRTE